jgi:signal transduction histidine kinase
VITVADLGALPIFQGLTDAQLSELVASGEEVPVVPGAEVFREGEPADSWWLLLDGAIELVRRIGREDAVVARMDQPGRWAGGFRAWDEAGVYLATGRGTTPGRLMRIPAIVLRDLSHAWFPFAGHLIEGLYRTARSIESTARQRSALVTLGSLAAGLAHEINNPAAAATRAIDALEDASDTLLAAPARLAGLGLSGDQIAALEELRSSVRPADDADDPLAASDRQQAVGSWLFRKGVGRAWELAGPLASAGIDVGWCERVAAVVENDALEPILDWVAGTLATTSLLVELKESTRRISELVAAVRSYSQLDRTAKQPTDIVAGLDSTLLIMSHRLRDGVTVLRDYRRPIPSIDAYAGELNQVWTNVIDNAVDAMDGQGTLRLAVRAEDQQVVVEITDSGAGMPDDVLARVFDPFFTTKEVGKGTGLGLDIARRIVVDRHGGSIEIDSEPGSTLIRVRLPLTGAVL